VSDHEASIHPAAAAGFGADADRYVSGRPDYPLAIDAWLRDALKLSQGKVVADLGAGTGKFLPRLASTGARIIAIEPVAAMRTQLSMRFPHVEVREGTAERMPLEKDAVDAVVCAQAFHWFANARALQEIRRVLKPGGALGLIWNIRDESVDWVAALTRILDVHEGDTPRYSSGAWRQMFPAPGFSDLVETSFAHSHTGPAQQVIVDRHMSVSFIAALPPPQQQQVLDEIHALMARTPALAARTVSMPYRTYAFCCRKVD
jgi:SAM-dependent methyltransferase